MEIKADEISKIIQRQIEESEIEIDIKEVGTVTSVGDGIVRIYGLDRVMYNELLSFPNEVYGVALNLEEDSTEATLTGTADGNKISATDTVCIVPQKKK